MPQVAEPLRPVRVLVKPTRYPPLRAFNCGRRGNSWEVMVHRWVRNAYSGLLPHPQTIVLLEDAHRKLVGAGGFRQDPLLHRDPEKNDQLTMDAYYIHMLAIDKLYQGQRLQDGSRPSDLLLQGMLGHIKARNGGSMPCVWALVSPKNTRSAALFERNGFGAIPPTGDGEAIHVLTPDGREPFAPPRKQRRLIRRLLPTGS